MKFSKKERKVGLPDVPRNRTEVLIDEEYGYRYWRFLFCGNHEALIAWWLQLESVSPFFFNPGTAIVELGLGQVEQIDQSQNRSRLNVVLGRCRLLLQIHEDDDSCLLVLGNSDKDQYLIPTSVVQRIYHAGAERTIY
ncbi:MAG: hypothetical protein AAB575_00425 [Patescibacteria group bacterium]